MERQSSNSRCNGSEDCAIRPFVTSFCRKTDRHDQVPFWSCRDLERKLLLFEEYYNRDRVHRELNRTAPDEKGGVMDRKIARLDDYRWKTRCRGLYQLPEAA